MSSGRDVGDFNNDNIVNVSDLNTLLTDWGAVYNVSDLNNLLTYWDKQFK